MKRFKNLLSGIKVHAIERCLLSTISVLVLNHESNRNSSHWRSRPIVGCIDKHCRPIVECSYSSSSTITLWFDFSPIGLCIGTVGNNLEQSETLTDTIIWGRAGWRGTLTQEHVGWPHLQSEHHCSREVICTKLSRPGQMGCLQHHYLSLS